MSRAAVRWSLCACVLAGPIAGLPAAAQESGGAIDTRAAVEKRIYELEGMMGGDVSAERQAVTLRWLADLYLSVGRADDAEAAYQRILVFYPYDVASSNAYAGFLLDTRKDAVRALEVTRAAIAWSRSALSPPPYLAATYALRARAFAAAGQCEDALRAAEEATTLSEEDAAEDARRTQVRCLTALGRDREAKQLLLEVIGESGASNPDDLSALVAMLTGDRKGVDARDLASIVADAVRDARKKRSQALAKEGAQMVELTGEDRVRLEATLRAGDGPSAILFVPEPDGRRSSFTAYAQLLMLDGFTTLALDPRGHGHSRGDSLRSFDDMPEHHRARLPSDVAAAYAFLVDTRGIDPSRIAIVAAGGACLVVERAIHEHNLSPVVVYLSPVFATDDRDLAAALSFRPPRPALVLASEEDLYAVRSMRAFSAARGSDAVRTKTYKSAGHGVSLLRDPARFLDVDTWLKETLAAGAPSARD